MSDSLETAALEYHRKPTRGKLSIQPTKPLSNQRDLALAYSPGVAHPCHKIAEDPQVAAEYTSRGNLVGVVTNGTAVLGLGALGALAAKPVMEGKAVLFKKFAGIDVFDIEVDETDIDRFVDAVAALEPTFGGINLEDIKAPECFFIEKKLRERMNIPVFHDDQHGTAICSAAAVYNGLRIVDKKIENAQLVVSGGGAASIACTDLLVSMGLKRENVLMIDSRGVIYAGREQGMNEWKAGYAVATDARTLDDAIVDADIFMGLSGPGVLTPDMCKKMARDPLILAMANPVPEIMPELAKEARPDAIIATGRSDYPNQVNNVLCFPFIFRGALDCGATTINEAMKLACVRAIADLAHQEASEAVARAYVGERLEFGPEYLIPKPFDPRLIEQVPLAVVEAAMESGVASRPIADLEDYAQQLKSHNHRSRIFMQAVIEFAKSHPARVAFSEGENSDVLRALQMVIDEGVARPVIIGRRTEVHRKIEKLNLRYEEGRDFDLVDPENNDNYAKHWKYYHEQVGRFGVSVESAQKIVRSNNTALAATMVALNDVDAILCGKAGRYDLHLRNVAAPLGYTLADKVRMSAVCALLHSDGPLFLTDPFVHVDPSAEQVVTNAENAIDFARKFDIEPKVALVSHSNFGSYEDPSAKKMKQASEILREKHPDIEIDGEMVAFSALNGDFRDTIMPQANLTGRANVLVMPNMDCASIALGMIRSLTAARLIGPYLYGLERSAHILIPSVSARGIFNMTALCSADAQKTGISSPADSR